MTTRFVGDTVILTGRSLRHITRSPDTIITTTIMPIAFMCCSSMCSAAPSAKGRGRLGT
jgi:hypothetical protein